MSLTWSRLTRLYWSTSKSNLTRLVIRKIRKYGKNSGLKFGAEYFYYHLFISTLSFNTRKIIELPFHSYKIDKKEFETSKYLVNLTWLHNKIKSTGCVQFLLDIYLTNPPPQSQSPSSTNKLSGHLEFLLNFIQTRFEALNYDAQQIYSLLSTYIKREAQSNNDIVKSWLKEIEDKNILIIEKIEFESEETVSSSDDSAENADGYDQLINTNNKTNENFIISVHTAREEICVWDVIK